VSDCKGGVSDTNEFVMEPVAEIPSPQPGDSDTVISLLEAAAVFSAKGDAAQALSWLQRAAASASEEGNDTRTLALARSASSLGERLRAPGALLGEASPLGAQRPAPGRPPRPGTVPPTPQDETEDDAGEATPILLSTRSERPPASVRPPPPSSRTASPPPVTPVPPSASGPTRGVASQAPRSGPPAKLTAANGSGAAPSAALGTPAPVVAKSTPSTAPTATPLVVKRAPSAAPTSAPLVAKSAPVAVTSVVAKGTTAVAPGAPAAGHRAREPWPMRDAARVSIVKSSTEPGLYYVRVLEDGKRPFEGFEGLLVALDPDSTLRH